MLTSRQNELWDKYCSAERDRIRSVTIPILERFLTALADTPMDSWKDWAYDLAAKHVDHKDTFPIRFPLFTKAIFPALLEGLNSGECNCARWLAGFELLIYKNKECKAALADLGYETTRELLYLALKQNPSDTLAREQLIRNISNYLDYTLHELPTAVLYDQNGADVAACLDLLQMLEEFKVLVCVQEVESKYEELLKDCQFHYFNYMQYLLNRDEYESYEAYLRQVEAQ
jgi:hypothetical protein